ncbi:MAG: 30S ribosomal protein THX [Lewinellaceae bacterium]|nr:30S ribosomal protein THX [Saprospiraceae bacterium]MCB9314354.1 30S ribosomal protein THX [Lewinellaceae bacterium]
MGRGDKRTKRGKIWRGSFGVSRPKAVNESAQAANKAAEAGKTAKGKSAATKAK